MHIILLFLYSCASDYGHQDFITQDKIYYTSSNQERQSAKAYIPEGKGPFPGVILVHGGGWNSRDNNDMRFIAKSLAGHGFTVLSINYRLVPEFLHPAPIEDLEKAFIYFKKNAERFKLQTNKIGLWGYSAGAHTTAFYALTRAKDPVLKVQAVVAGGGPFNLAAAPDSRQVRAYLGVEMKDRPDIYNEASPQYLVTPEAPPFFLYHALIDDNVDHARTTDFEKKLKENQVEVERLDIRILGHVTAFIFSKEALQKGIIFLKKKLKD